MQIEMSSLLNYCAILEQECSTLWGNDAKCLIIVYKKIRSLSKKSKIYNSMRG